MGVARGLERRLERLVDGLAARLFRGRVHPVELGTRLVREADLALFETPGGPGAPNVYRVVLGGESVEDEVLTTARDELAQFVEDAAGDRGWRLEGPASVEVVVDPERRASDVEIECWVDPAPRLPWAVLVAEDDGEVLPITVNRAVIGRSGGSDVHVPRPDVSRSHAVIWQEAGSGWIADLGSSNGTFVNGERVWDPAPIVEGDRIALGQIEFVVKPPA